MKKLLCILLCLLLLTGCGAEAAPDVLEGLPAAAETDAPAGSSPAADAAPIESVDEDGDSRYLTYDTLALPGGIEMAVAQCLLGDRIYAGGLSRDGAVLAWTDLNGKGGVLELPEDITYIYALCPAGDGFVLLGGDAPSGYRSWDGSVVLTDDPSGNLWVAAYDADGGLTGSTALQEKYTERTMNFQYLLAAEDSCFMLCQNLIIKIGADGSELCRVEVESPHDHEFQGMALLDGSLYALTGNMFLAQDYKLLQLDPETLETKNTYVLQCDSISGLGASEANEILLNYTSGGQEAIGSFDLETCGISCLFDWSGVGAAAEGMIQPWEDGYVFFERYETEIALLEWTSGQRPERITLQMAVTGINDISQLVQEFNLSQELYQIQITTYGDVLNNDKAIDVLRTEILAGNTPDLYCFCDFGAGGGVETGGIDLSIFGLDLTPLLDADSVYSREAFVPALLDGMETDGGLYALPLAFDIWTVKAPSALIPEPGLTFEELEAVRETAGSDWLPFESWVDAATLLGWTAHFAAGHYVDYEAGTCQFESEDFIDYLTWCKTWAGDGSIQGPYDQVILTLSNIISTKEVTTATAQAEANNGYTYVGIPVSSGYGSMFQVAVELGISNQSANPDGAWAFIRYCLSHLDEDVLNGLPALQSVIDDQVAWYMSGEAVDWRGVALTASQACVDKFYDLLEQTTVMAGTDEILIGIIKDEADYYFSNSRSAEETAKIIQNRASLYLMETSGG